MNTATTAAIEKLSECQELASSIAKNYGDKTALELSTLLQSLGYTGSIVNINFRAVREHFAAVA